MSFVRTAPRIGRLGTCDCSTSRVPDVVYTLGNPVVTGEASTFLFVEFGQRWQRFAGVLPLM